MSAGADVKAGWFAELCAQHDLVPVAPVTADQLTTEHVLFTVAGDPRPIASVRKSERTVTVRYTDGWEDSWPKDMRMTLIARNAA